jgi:hypothetical protein
MYMMEFVKTILTDQRTTLLRVNVISEMSVM